MVADQFAKRGIVSDRVRDKALVIIDQNSDHNVLEKLGMSEPDLRKRKKMLDGLRARLVAIERATLGHRVNLRIPIGGCRRGPLGMLPA